MGFSGDWVLQEVPVCFYFCVHERIRTVHGDSLLHQVLLYAIGTSASLYDVEQRAALSTDKPSAKFAIME